MDFTFQYCPERRRLETCNWSLVSKLSVLTDKLMQLIGKDHGEFITMKAKCTVARQEAFESRDQLLAHRAEHGC